MGQFSVKIWGSTGSLLSGNQQIDRQTLVDLNATGTTAGEVADKLLKREKLDPEIRARAKIVKEVDEADPVWYRKAGMTQDGGVAVYHRLPGRLLKKISNRPSTIFVSATLSVNNKLNDFKRAMGIEQISPLSQVIEPKKHGQLYFYFVTDHPVDTEEWISVVVDEINASEGPTLVATPSHKLAEEIGEKIPDATVRSRDETTADAVGRMGDSQVLIAAGAWAGLDTPIAWKTVVIPRIPFIGPKELFDGWDADENPDLRIGDPISSYLDSRNAAARRVVQVMGRGLRSPDAKCAIVICDPRVSQLGDIVPSRFHEGWFEGRRDERKISTSERNPRLRREALRHYGTTCCTCGRQPIVTLREVEVHHLNPLADRGPAHTKLEDVAVMCRNCHAIAHTKNNDVLSLDEIREHVRKAGAKSTSVIEF